VEVWDSKLSGFGVRASESGAKSFVLLYRVGGRSRRLTLGRYPIVSLAEARNLARRALNQLAHGVDPQAKRREGRSQYGFRDICASFLEKHGAQHTRLATRQQSERVLKKHFGKGWGNRDIREIRKQDVIAVLDALVASGRPSAANNALAVVRKFFNWCVERALLEHSPCAGIQRPARTSTRDRVLDEKELTSVWHASEKIGYPFGTIVQLLILTAQRRNEVAGMRWRDLDLAKGIWTLPAESTKNNRAHVVPLSARAQKILSAVPKLNDELVFPARGNTERSFSGFGKSKSRLERIAERDGWTLHDLRRSAATHLARLGVAPHVVERVLNHVSGSLGGVAGIYNRFGYEPEMRDALDLWAKHIEDLISRTDDATTPSRPVATGLRMAHPDAAQRERGACVS
jgi:integrase